MGTKPNPKHLALSAIAGAMLAASAFLVLFIPALHFDTVSGDFWANQWANRVRTLALLTPFAAGCTLWLLAYRRLSRNYANDLWNETELSPVRALLEQPFWAWISLSLFALVITAAAFTKHGVTLICLIMLPMNAVSSMRRLLAPPVERTSSLIDWQSSKPLHSDHWGKPAHQRNEALPS